MVSEGATSGRSALLGLEGTSLSRDPNVSFHRFAGQDPSRLLVAEMPAWLQAQTRNMTVDDFLNTKGLLEENPDIALYNKPSSLYKELETFVRRSHVPDKTGQMSLFRPSDYLKFRRPTDEEMGYVSTVAQKTSDAVKEAKSVNLRSRLAWGAPQFKYVENDFMCKRPDVQRIFDERTSGIFDVQERQRIRTEIAEEND